MLLSITWELTKFNYINVELFKKINLIREYSHRKFIFNFDSKVLRKVLKNGECLKLSLDYSKNDNKLKNFFQEKFLLLKIDKIKIYFKLKKYQYFSLKNLFFWQYFRNPFPAKMPYLIRFHLAVFCLLTHFK